MNEKRRGWEGKEEERRGAAAAAASARTDGRSKEACAVSRTDGVTDVALSHVALSPAHLRESLT